MKRNQPTRGLLPGVAAREAIAQIDRKAFSAVSQGVRLGLIDSAESELARVRRHIKSMDALFSLIDKAGG